MINVQIMQTAR